MSRTRVLSDFAEQRLHRIRMDARHEGLPLTREAILSFVHEDHLDQVMVIEAHALGMADRQSGMRCLCQRCEVDFQRIETHQRLRTDYYLKRRAELLASGMDSAEIERRIDTEIRAGAALRGATHN